MKNICLFTHTDLDGVACSIIMRKFYDNYKEDFHISHNFCNYDDIDSAVLNLMEIVEPSTVDFIYITDISVKDETAEKLDKFCKDNNIQLNLIDHHGTAVRLNKYDWANVITNYDENRKTCGASLLFDHLYMNAEYAPKPMRVFVEMVRLWDTYQFETAGDFGELAKDLNYLFQNMQRNDFIQSMCCDYLYDMHESFLAYLPDHAVIIAKAREREDAVFEDAKARLMIVGKDDHLAGFYFGGSYTSQVCNRLCKDNPKLDYVCCINTVRGILEFRSIKDNINLGKDVASKWGGGGHPKAAGAQISEVVFYEMLGSILNTDRE